MRAIDQPSFRAHQPSTAVLALVAMSLILLPDARRAWGLDGPQITAYIAADHLSPIARRHVAQILGVADEPTAVAGAMARAAGRPDLEFRTSAPETLDWDWINVGNCRCYA